MKITRRSVLQAAGTAAVVPFARTAFAASDSITIAYPADVPSWDAVAHTTPLAMPMFKSVFDSPLTSSPTLELVPNVIREWHVGGENGTVIELVFRDDVSFHNGDRLTAEGQVQFVSEERVGGRVRRSYGLTESGSAALRAEAVRMAEAAQLVIGQARETTAGPLARKLRTT